MAAHEDELQLLVGDGRTVAFHPEDDFCERLASGPRFVIRYDHRDTGRSVTYPPGAPQYTLRDLAADAVGLLNGFGLATAHLVGMSMGGSIAQLVALDHPDRVASLTLIATSSVSPLQPDPDLPGMSEELLARFAARPMPDWSDRAAVIEFLVDSQRLLSGSRPFDEAAARAALGRVVDRSTAIASSMTNHNVMEGGDRWRDRLGGITTPTLVIHGSEDPVFPQGHGLALAREIPGAQLLLLERTGHELPRTVWDLVIPPLLRHTSGS
jgi:pimeloyl-ACP methyl ester carboxylesterase